MFMHVHLLSMRERSVLGIAVANPRVGVSASAIQGAIQPARLISGNINLSEDTLLERLSMCLRSGAMLFRNYARFDAQGATGDAIRSCHARDASPEAKPA